MQKIVLEIYRGTEFKLYESFNFTFENENITIEKGYNTDGASVPRGFWNVYPKYRADYFKASLIHDYLCSKAIHAKDYNQALKKYEFADRAFKHFLEENKVKKITISIFYNFVRIKHFLTCKFKLIKLKQP